MSVGITYALNLIIPIEKPKGTTIASKIVLLQSEKPVFAECRDCGSDSRLSLQDKADCGLLHGKTRAYPLSAALTKI